MSIIVRPFQEADRPAVDAMHSSMGLDYKAPDWAKMAVSCVVERDGKPAMATFLRPTAETFLLLDKDSGRKRDHLADLLITHREMIAPMKSKGLSDCHAWLAPALEEANFGKLLMNLSWKKQLWNSYCFEVK